MNVERSRRADFQIHSETGFFTNGRAAEWTLQNLDRSRVRNRPPDDEIDAYLRALTVTAHAWQQSQRRNLAAVASGEPLPPRPLSTQDVAAMHRVHEASVRRAILAGRLEATRGRYGWEIPPAAAQDWRPRKARSANRAA